MGLFSALATSASGLTAERLKLDVIADNIANANTTRTTDGGPFRRSRVIYRPRTDEPYWNSPFIPDRLDNGIGKGVRVSKIEKDMDSELRLVYDPSHPDAIQKGELEGYVQYPNVNIVNEMVDMINATRSYEANVSLMEGSKSMFRKALDIGK